MRTPLAYSPRDRLFRGLARGNHFASGSSLNSIYLLNVRCYCGDKVTMLALETMLIKGFCMLAQASHSFDGSGQPAQSHSPYIMLVLNTYGGGKVRIHACRSASGFGTTWPRILEMRQCVDVLENFVASSRSGLFCGLEQVINWPFSGRIQRKGVLLILTIRLGQNREKSCIRQCPFVKSCSR